MSSNDILEMLKEIPRLSHALPTLTIRVDNGIYEATQDIINQDEMIDLMFDLSIYGGQIIDLSYDISKRDELGFCILHLDMKVIKTMQEDSNIDADVIEEIGKIIGR